MNTALKLNNLIFAVSNKKDISATRSLQSSSSSSFKKVFSSIANKTNKVENDVPDTWQSDCNKSFCSPSQIGMYRSISQGNKESESAENRDLINTLQSGVTDAKENEQILNSVLALLLALMQNAENQQTKISLENPGSIDGQSFVSAKDLAEVLNLEIPKQDKVIGTLYNMLVQIDEGKNFGSSDEKYLFLSLDSGQNDALTLLSGASDKIDDKNGIEDILSEILKNVLSKDENKGKTSNYFASVNDRSTFEFVKDMIFLLQSTEKVAGKDSDNIREIFLQFEELFKELVSKTSDNSKNQNNAALDNLLYTKLDGQSKEDFKLQLKSNIEEKNSSLQSDQPTEGVFLRQNVNTLSITDIKNNNESVKTLRFSIIQQVAEKISLIHRQNITTLTVAIKPEWLGNVLIELNKDLNGNITGNIVVTSPHVKEVIEGSMNNLLTILKDQGINISQLNVSLGSGSGNQQFQNQQRFSQKQYSFVSANDTVDMLESLLYEINENVLNLRA